MPEKTKQVFPVQVDYVCDKCGQGNMLPAGACLTSYPPQFGHICEHCGHAQYLGSQYPFIRYVEGRFAHGTIADPSRDNSHVVTAAYPIVFVQDPPSAP